MKNNLSCFIIFISIIGHRIHTVYFGTDVAPNRRHSHRRHKHHRNSQNGKGAGLDNADMQNRPGKFGVVWCNWLKSKLQIKKFLRFAILCICVMQNISCILLACL